MTASKPSASIGPPSRLIRQSFASIGRLLRGLMLCSTLALTCVGPKLAFAQDAPAKPMPSPPPKTMGIRIEEVDGLKSKPFYEVLTKALKKRKTPLESMCPRGDTVAQRVLEEYGAMFIATKKVLAPPVCVFTSEDQVTNFQEKAGYQTEFISYDDVELQPEAMKSLLKAIEEAKKEGLAITPRDGAEAGRRNYEDSLRLWDTRFLPALDHWLGQQRLTTADVERLRALPTHDQIAAVLELEKGGMFFSKDLSKSILYSIAAPGTSQHIAMLAFDVTEFYDVRVREILAKHGWFQTVLSDLPHFTYLGHKEKDLPKQGLKAVIVDQQKFWIPNV